MHNQQALERFDHRVQEPGLRVDEVRQAGCQRQAALEQMHEHERWLRQQEIEAADKADQERMASAQKRLADMAERREQAEGERQPAAAIVLIPFVDNPNSTLTKTEITAVLCGVRRCPAA